MEVKSFFDIVNAILEKKQVSREDIQAQCNQYMVGSMLSCDASFAEIAHELAKLKLTNKMYYDCLYHGLPKIKKFIKWNASKAKKEQNIMYLMDYFKCSQNTAKEYESLIEPKELEQIVEHYKTRGN